MRTCSLVAIAVAGLLASARVAAEIVPYLIQVATFVVPVNLTNLSPDMPKVGVNCSAMAGAVLVTTPVVDGKVNTVLEVKVPLPEPKGARLTYWCNLIVFGPPGSGYEEGGFADSVGTSAPKEVQITPVPPVYKGEIIW
jgi:hypothetical protein